MQITSETLLEKGTPVRVGNKRGVVTRSNLAPACNGGQIALNTIRFTARFKRAFGKAGCWEKIKPVSQTVNYSFIQLEK